MTKVSIVKCADYVQENMDRAIQEALDLIGGLGGLINPRDKVLLKINLLSPAEPDKAVITHPSLIKSMIKLVKRAGGIPIIADSPGSFSTNRKNTAMIKSGIKEIADTMGVKALQFETLDNAFVKTEVPKGVWLKTIYAARLALEADVIINLPKLKTHCNTLYTGAVKNMFGPIAPKTRKTAHNLGSYRKFSGSVVDIYSVLKPQLAVMDAVVGMEGNGPSNGKPKHVGIILASYDSVALDAVAEKIIGYEPGEIHTTRLAAERGLGTGNLNQINILGEKIGKVAVNFKKPRIIFTNIPPFLVQLYHSLVRIEPHLVKNKCTMCDACAQGCPPGAIKMNPYPVIDRKHCILCYCCIELCSEGAMEIKKNWLARVYEGLLSILKGMRKT